MNKIAKLKKLFEIGRHPLRQTQRSQQLLGHIVLESLEFTTIKGERVRAPDAA